MVYHFVKQIEIDVEADSLGRAIDFINDIDDTCEEQIAELIEDINDFTDDVDGLDVHSVHTEYVGCTNRSTVRDETTAEELLRDYLNSKDDDEDDEDGEDPDSAGVISPEALAGLILAGFLASIIDTRG